MMQQMMRQPFDARDDPRNGVEGCSTPTRYNTQSSINNLASNVEQSRPVMETVASSSELKLTARHTTRP